MPYTPQRRPGEGRNQPRPEGSARPEAAPQPEDTSQPWVEARVAELRRSIDEIDSAVIELLRRRAQLSRQVQKARIAQRGARIAPAREDRVREHFRSNLLGTRGEQVAGAVLLLCRGGCPSAAAANGNAAAADGNDATGRSYR
ncbi:chorismate mutase [Streptomyces smyrnaeus]|uniref:chorismate mutase n=1 Tax=Streptomyces TaxID=1883 RepID=UPI001B386B71|nr:chorismate mutase [Streptomyces sp. RK75]MBQ0866862.1 chorismate mutase [Streptomyces sp. RK75]